MAVQGPFRVECDAVFPFGLGMVGVVTPLADYDRSTGEVKVQQLDKHTSLPMWQIDVIDFDPEARERTFKVKIVSPTEPKSPPPADGPIPVRPIRLEGLQVTPYMKSMGLDRQGHERQRIAYSLRATGLIPAREQGRPAAGGGASDASKAA